MSGPPARNIAVWMIVLSPFGLAVAFILWLWYLGKQGVAVLLRAQQREYDRQQRRNRP